MSHEEDQCFQCQELGHITCHCPNVCCFKCEEYGHIVVDCPHQIQPSDTPAHCHRHDSKPGIVQDLLLDTITRTGTYTEDQGCSPIPTDMEVTVIMTPTEAVPGHVIETVDATIGVLHDAITPVLAIFAMTHHIEDHLHIGVLQLIQRLQQTPIMFCI